MAMARGRVAQTASVPAPVGGLNARDSISAMPATDAYAMVNWFPSTTNIGVRNGSTTFCSGFPGWVETVIPFNGQNGTNKLFGASGTGIYDASGGGTVGAAVVTGQTSARCQYQQYANTAGSWLYVVNGSDYPQLYNGSAWQQVTTVSAPISLTGGPASLTSLIQVYNWQQRLLFIEKNSCRFHYLPVLQVGGALSTFDLGPQFRMGGYLVAFADWNAVTMTGPQDYAAFISSNGEVLVYQGYDPSLPGAWSLVGRFRIGRPIGNRCLTKVGADVYALTVDGLVKFSASQMDERSEAAIEAETSKIQNAINNDAATYGSNFGWECILHPLGNKVIVNVPQVENSTQYQYVRNQINNSWTVFQGWNACCWALQGDKLYFGTSGKIVQADTGKSDDGQPINTDLVPAFNYFGDEGTNKLFTMFRAVFNSDAPVTASFAFCTDFVVNTPHASLGAPSASGSPWNTSYWNVALWSSGLQPRFSWQGATGYGFNAALRVKTASTSATLQLFSIDYAFEPGAVL